MRCVTTTSCTRRRRPRSCPSTWPRRVRGGSLRRRSSIWSSTCRPSRGKHVVIRFASERDGAALGAYLERLLHFDKGAAVRFVGVGPAAAAYSGPPFGGRPVLALWLSALQQDTEPFDVTVLAGKLLEGLSRDESELTIPETMVGGPSWAGLLPPRSGWSRVGMISVRELGRAAAQGNADFRFRALGRDRATLDALGEGISCRP